MATPTPTGADSGTVHENARPRGPAPPDAGNAVAPTLLGPAVALVTILLLSAAYALPPQNAFPDGLNPTLGATHVILWLALLVLLGVFLFWVGWHYSGHPFGILVSRRNTYSLSQLQLVAWTLLVTSAAWALFLIRMRDGAAGAALAFEIPSEVPALLGVGTISFGTTAAIHGAKKGKVADPRDIEKAKRSALKVKGGDYAREWSATLKTATPKDIAGVVGQARSDMRGLELTQKLPEEGPLLHAATKEIGLTPGAKALQTNSAAFVTWMWDQMDREIDGVLYRNRDIKDARLRDVIEGDEITNAHNLDLGKLQMLLFTLLAIVAYALLLFQMFAAGAAGGQGLPGISEGLVGILGASHLGYLGTKASAQTRSVTT